MTPGVVPRNLAFVEAAWQITVRYVVYLRASMPRRAQGPGFEVRQRAGAATWYEAILRDLQLDKAVVQMTKS